ncbi:hypothetical protein BJV77DRAFT_964686 [Russula vinacea]|nr:hypothetical protein BJV77DRAFT_964686 [Russula vinacea]
MEPNNDIDTETLQAQIDLSMAYAQNLIASWLPSSGPITQSSSRAAEAEVELQALLRRPPRLGVGAPIPEAPTPAQTRLVQKLEGGKRRARELLENGARATTANNKDEQGEEQDSAAEESRAAGIAIRKRQRVDPFEPGGKKKKRKMVVGGLVETARAKDDVETETGEAPRSGSMATDVPKKKKRHLSESQGALGHVAHGGPGGEARAAHLDAEITQDAEPSTSTQSSLLEEEWGGISQGQRGSLSGSPVASSGVGASPASPPMVPLKPLPRSLSMSPTQRFPTTPIPSALLPSSLPILNLTGAPPIAPEKMEPSPLKKRRRKRKKKKPSIGQGADDGPP